MNKRQEIVFLKLKIITYIWQIESGAIPNTHESTHTHALTHTYLQMDVSCFNFTEILFYVLAELLYKPT